MGGLGGFSELLVDFDAEGSKGEGDSFLARAVEPFLEALLQNIDGIQRAEVIMGGMTSSLVFCVWSGDRKAAATDIQRRIGLETEQVTRITSELSRRIFAQEQEERQRDR